MHVTEEEEDGGNASATLLLITKSSQTLRRMPSLSMQQASQDDEQTSEIQFTIITWKNLGYVRSSLGDAGYHLLSLKYNNLCNLFMSLLLHYMNFGETITRLIANQFHLNPNSPSTEFTTATGEITGYNISSAALTRRVQLSPSAKSAAMRV